jgi:hypothetical protein
MLRMTCLAATVLICIATSSAAQDIPTTIAAAESEGARHLRGETPSVVAPIFAHPFAGTEKRKCVAPPADIDVSSGSLRSGDFIVRGYFSGEGGPRAKHDRKFLWTPLHNPYVYEQSTGLLIRGARIGHAADTLRKSIAHAAYPSLKLRRSDAAFPSLLRFPVAGEWLVVASTESDWGCFLLTVVAE